jgi:PDZ domain-containing secreted protein
VALACALTAVLSTGAEGETVTRTVTVDAGSVQGQPCSLDELGAVVAQVENEFKVLFVMEPAQRLKAYQNVDLRAEDRLLMVNGTKLASIEQLRGLLDSAAVGSTLQLGIRRDKDMQIVSYAKADPASLPKVTRKFVTMEGGPEGPKTTEQTFTSAEGGGETVAILRGAGVIVRQAEGHLAVLYLMPLSASIEALAGLKEGDHVVSLQGQKAESLDGLESIWNGLATGDPVKLVCRRDDVEHTYEFPKPDASKDQGGAMMITK